MQQHRQALPPGTRLHEYELLDVLGSGGFGVVYLAHDHGLDQQVVIKEYLPSGCAVRIAGNTVVATTSKDEEVFQWGLERFLNEARALAEFRQHPNIVSVLRHFHANNTGYMVMEYAGSFSLQEYLEQHGTLGETQLQAVIFPLLDALEKVHAKGMIHRDLKPGNILINAQEQPVLIDFGSARQAVGHKTQSLTAIVTHGYSPFEQYTKTGNQGAWTDIYALAAVMYRCVTGKIPPDALERLAPETKPLHTAADTAGSYAPALLTAIDWGLQVRVEDRPQSIARWREAWEKTEDRPVDPPISFAQRLRARLRAVRAMHLRPLLVPVLSVLLVVGAALLFSQYVASVQAAEMQKRELAVKEAAEAAAETARQQLLQAQAAKIAAENLARQQAEEANARLLAEQAALEAQEAADKLAKEQQAAASVKPDVKRTTPTSDKGKSKGTSTTKTRCKRKNGCRSTPKEPPVVQPTPRPRPPVRPPVRKYVQPQRDDRMPDIF